MNYSRPFYFSQGSVATDLRGGGSFNSIFLRRSFLNLTVKNYENWSTSNNVLPFGARGSDNYASPRTKLHYRELWSIHCDLTRPIVDLCQLLELSVLRPYSNIELVRELN